MAHKTVRRGLPTCYLQGLESKRDVCSYIFNVRVKLLVVHSQPCGETSIPTVCPFSCIFWLGYMVRQNLRFLASMALWLGSG